MGSLREKNNTLNAVVGGLLEKIKFFELQLEKNSRDMSCLSRSIETIDNDFLEIGKITQENKSIFYRFVPQDKDLFNEPGKSKFRDQYHKIDNLLHSSNFAVECLKDQTGELLDEKDNILKNVVFLRENVEALNELMQKINTVVYGFIKPDADLFTIISKVKEDNKIVKILIVDDMPGTLCFSQMVLANNGFKTFTASTVDEAIKNIKENCPNIVLLDLNLESNMDGIKILKFIRDNNLSIKCVVDTVIDNEEQLSLVSALKPEKILVKPFDVNQLLAQINAVIQDSRN